MKKNNLLSNIMYNALFQVFNLIIPLITLPYIARVFNPEIIGIYSYTLSFVQVFVLIGGFGLLNYGARLIAMTKNEYERSQKFLDVWFVQIIMSIISFLLLIILTVLILPYKYYFLLQSLLVLVNMFEVSWFFIGIEKFKNVSIRNILIKLVLTCTIFLFIKNETQLPLYILLNIGATLLGNLSMFISLKINADIKTFEVQNFKCHLRPAFSLLLPQLVTLMYTTLDKTILGTISTEAQVGYYDQAQKIIRVSIALVGSVSTVLMPRMTSLISSRNYNQFLNLLRKSIHLTNIVSFLIVSIIVVVSQDFVLWFYGEEYAIVGVLMIITSVIGLLIPNTVLVGNAVLIPHGKEKHITVSSIFAAIFSLLLNFTLDYRWGALGACFSLIIAELIAFLFRTFYAQKIIKFSLFDKNLFQIFISSLLTILIGCIFISNFDNPFIGSVLASLLMTVVYIFILYHLRNENIIILHNQFINKLKGVTR